MSKEAQQQIDEQRQRDEAGLFVVDHSEESWYDNWDRPTRYGTMIEITAPPRESRDERQGPSVFIRAVDVLRITQSQHPHAEYDLWVKTGHGSVAYPLVFADLQWVREMLEG